VFFYLSRDRVAEANADAKLEVEDWLEPERTAAAAAPMAPEAAREPPESRLEMCETITAQRAGRRRFERRRGNAACQPGL
jgi:hypothetical protein